MKRTEVSERLARHTEARYASETGQDAAIYAGKIWAYFDGSRHAYCVRGEALAPHPDLRGTYPNGWSLLDYVKPGEALARVAATVTRYKVSTRGDKWKYFASKDEALAYEAARRAKDGVFRAVVAYQVNA